MTPSPPERVEMDVTEVEKKPDHSDEEASSLFHVKLPDQLQEDLPQLPYATAFTNLIRFLNLIKEHSDLIEKGEVQVPRGNFLYISPEGESINRCIALIAHQFNAKFVELKTAYILTENAASTQIILAAREKCKEGPATEASIIYIPDFGEFLAGLLNPIQQFLLGNMLAQNRIQHNPTVIVAEIHDIKQVITSVRVQFDFLENIPPLSRAETVSLLRDIVKFDLPWDSPDLITTPLWLNQLQKVGERINLLCLSGRNSEHKVLEKDITKIIREMENSSALPTSQPDKMRTLQVQTQGDAPEAFPPKNNSFGDQILQDIASSSFALASGVLDKLDRGEPLKGLTDLERGLLAEYSILLSDDPRKLKIRLLNAKKRVDAIQNAFKRS